MEAILRAQSRGMNSHVYVLAVIFTFTATAGFCPARNEHLETLA
jgi:hypothetical protein